MKTKPKRHVCGEIVFLDEAGGFHHRLDREGILPPMTKCPVCKHDLGDGWFRPLYKVEPMTRQMMERTISRNFGKACSNCWGYAFYVEDAFIQPEDEDEDAEPIHMYYVLCVNCKEETQGYVSPGYVGWARRKDFEDYSLSILSLAPALGLEINEPKERKGASIETNLQDLGF